MAEVTLQNITKRFKRTTALSEVSFSIRDGEFFVLLGPSGAGKTTTLRLIAGLERQDSGDILIDNQVVNDATPSDRDVAFVFQQYSLYPTMSVYDNLAFPLRSPMRRTPEAEIRARVGEAAEKLKIAHLLERKTARLSGGEMQRVSIGRAIVRDPQIFLMDEPLSNLDAKLREALRIELKHLQKTRASTTLFVTHDQIEALTMADRIAVLDKGKIVQIGTPHDIYDLPITTFVAQLVGSPRINMIDAARENGKIHVLDSPIELPIERLAGDLPASFTLGIRPEDIHPRAHGAFEGRVALIEPLGVETLVHIKAGRQMLVSTVPGMTRLRLGDDLRFDIVRERLHFFDPGGRRVRSQEPGAVKQSSG